MGQGQGPPVRRPAVARGTPAWTEAFERARDSLPGSSGIIRLRAYRQLDAFTHIITIDGRDGDELRRITRVSDLSGDHAQGLCEMAFCEWLADKAEPVPPPPPPAPAPAVAHPIPHPGARNRQAAVKARILG